MEKYKEHLTFPGIVLLIVGAVAFQMTRSEAVALPSDPPKVVKTISFGVMESARGVIAQPKVAPI